MYNSRFRNKKVLVTGHTGFKGAWLAFWLELLGAEVIGISLDPLHSNGVFELTGIGRAIKDYRTDIRDLNALVEIFAAERPEIVFHLAAQALVLESYRSPIGTFSTNILGTAHILEAIRQTTSVRAAVMITSDKCYQNREWVYGYRENDFLGGRDPYSASKGAAELVIASYRDSFLNAERRVGIASARAGNVIGGGDWAENRMVPDIIRALEQGKAVQVRNPASVRPWQHVLEPLSGYLQLAARLVDEPAKFAGPWNFGPFPANCLSVRKLVENFIRYFEKGSWIDVSEPNQPHEANLLSLDISKAVTQLKWAPVLSFEETVAWTAKWYQNASKDSAPGLCREQINKYMNRSSRWARLEVAKEESLA